MFGFGSRPPYKIGLALSGGGARGFAHAGAIKALYEMGIHPDIIAGVSAGSVVAVMVASGIRPQRVLELFQSAKFTDFCDISVPRAGFFKMDSFRAFLRRNIPYDSIEQLPIPVLIGATNIDNGTWVTFDRGPIAERVAASCSIPIVFNPMKIDGVRYVDGGVLHNLPARAIRPLCKYLIGVNCSPLIDSEVGSSMIDIALRSYELMAKANAVPDMNVCDIVIRTDAIAHYKVFNLKQIQSVFDSGYLQTRNFLLANGFKPASGLLPGVK